MYPLTMLALDYANPFDALAALGARAPGRGAIILGGQRFEVPGDVVLNFVDAPRCAPPVTDFTTRSKPPQSITLHTNHGQPHDPALLPGFAADTAVCTLSQYQTETEREVSWDFSNGRTGIVTQQNDPLRRYTWQAGNVNGYSIGIENEQGPGGALYKGQMAALVRLCDELTRRLGIQRQVPAVWINGRRVPDRRVLARFGPGEDGRTWWGIFGHRNVTTQRGPGDPGDVVIQAFLDAGYEGFDVAAWEDFRVWGARQRQLGVPVTGMPGPETVAALKARGFPHGIYVWRPGD